MIELKSKLRKDIRNKLNSISSQEKDRKNSAITAKLKTFISTLENKKLIGGYAPMSNEANWLGKFTDQELCFPFPLSEGEMEFKKSQAGDLESSRKFGPEIMVPNSSRATVTPDLMLVPGVAFTKAGVRLGHGGGYYDKYLENFKGLKIGICFQEQIIHDIPTEDHDIKMDYLACEVGVEACSCA